jgi:ubiquitin C-terminal hydrolase
MGQGHSSSHLLKELGPDFPADRKFFHFNNPNTHCYCNSVLQAMLNSRYLCLYFDGVHQVFHVNPQIPRFRKSPLAGFYQLFEGLYRPNRREFFAGVSPLLKYVRKETDQFRSGEHSDCHEFFVFLIDSFGRTLKAMNERYGNDTFPLFDPLFEGKKSVTFECRACEFRQTISDSFCFLYLGLQGESTDDFQTRLDKLGGPEPLKGADRWRCDRCTVDRDATMSVVYEKLPPVCVIQLQRFRYNRTSRNVLKISYFLEIPAVVNLREGAESVPYELKTIIVHLGQGINKGHYVALIRVCNRWILANDTKLHPVDEAEFQAYIGKRTMKGVVSPAAYLLFFERMNED